LQLPRWRLTPSRAGGGRRHGRGRLFHGEVLRDGCPEAAGFDGDGVMSGRKKREAIVAATVRVAGARLVSPEVGQGDVGTGTTAPVASVTVPRISAVVS
jgi:hypothetical protein